MLCYIFGHVILLLLKLIVAEHSFQTYYGKLISLTQHCIVGNHVVSSINQFRKHCLEVKEGSRGANLIPTRRRVYSCELINKITCNDAHQKGSLSIRRKDNYSQYRISSRLNLYVYWRGAPPWSSW